MPNIRPTMPLEHRDFVEYKDNKDGTRTKIKETYIYMHETIVKENSKKLLNIVYNTDGNYCLDTEEQLVAFEEHYNLKLTEGTELLLRELGYFKGIEIPEYSVDDQNGKKELNKLQKTFEDTMHLIYTKLSEMGLIGHNKAKGTPNPQGPF